jgi:2,4-dienoyl-CoA reductase-like NADH-dependent reductase (Old Yellow Enzyme family)
VPFDDKSITPDALTADGIAGVVRAFVDAAKRALTAGFEVVEIHGAHGYLIHEFLSPLSNRRTDTYGGSFENRVRFARDIIRAVRAVWPERLPLFLRISATDWTPGGWDLEQSCELGSLVKDDGVALIDVSSGALVPAKVPVGPGYQTAFAAEIRRRAGIATGAVGMITAPEQADHIIRSGQADVVSLAREMLRDPYWPRRAAHALGAKIEGPPQYGRAW